MARARFDKWIKGIRPDDSVEKAAEICVRKRLAGVQYHLPLAAERAEEDVEYVHQLRVCTRRAMAALRMFANVLPRRRTAWLKKQLRRIRTAAGHARDFDVMAARQSDARKTEDQNRFLDEIRRMREDAQHPIVGVNRRLQAGHRFDRRIAGLLNRIPPKSKRSRRKRRYFADWARIRLRPIVRKFFKAIPKDAADAEALHRLRIRGKELRYAMELLAPAFPRSFRRELYPVIETLQNTLGDINDRTVAIKRLREWIEAADDPGRADWLETRLEHEIDAAEDAQQRFEGWWSPERADELKHRFAEILMESRRRGPDESART